MHSAACLGQWTWVKRPGYYVTPKRENCDLKKAPPRPPPLAFGAHLKSDTLGGTYKQKFEVLLKIVCLFDLGFGLCLGQKTKLFL